MENKISNGDSYAYDSSNRLWGYDLKYSDGATNKRGTMIRSGRPKQITGDGIEDYPNKLYKEFPSRHYTFVFNTFVML